MSLRLSRGLLILLLSSALLALALALDASPWLRGGYGWRWPYEPAPSGRALLLSGALALYLAGAWVLLRRSRRAAPALLWGMVGAAILPLLVIALRHDDIVYELFVRTASPMTTGPHMAAATIDWQGNAWHDWPAVMQDLHERGNRHAALSPPGLPLWNRAVTLALERIPPVTDVLHRALLPYQCHNFNLLGYTSAEWASAWFGMLMPLWAALTVFPLYWVAVWLLDTVRARQVVLWWALVPAVIMFAPSWNTIYPLLSLVSFGLLLSGLAQGPTRVWGAARLIAAGIVCGLLTFANLSTVPLLGLPGFYTLFYALVRQGRPGLRQALITGLWVGSGLALPWLVYSLSTGQTPWGITRAAMELHLDLEREYLPWVFLHLWEWMLLSGLALILLWLVAGIRPMRTAGDSALLALALIATLLVVDLSGLARGETGRVWLFFTPFALIAAGDGLRRLAPQNSDQPAWLVVSVAQALLTLALATHWNVIGSELTPPPPSPGSAGTTRPADALFGGILRLRGWDAVVEDGQMIVHLDWQPVERPTVPYFFSALLVTPDGRPAAEAIVWQPHQTHYPATCWAPGSVTGDSVILPWPPDPMPGDWWISLAVLGDATENYQPLPVTGSADYQVGLGPITVP
ncbi:MAG: hypothetical protein Kow00106_25380 [Anaerolineae bacterium]